MAKAYYHLVLTKSYISSYGGLSQASHSPLSPKKETLPSTLTPFMFPANFSWAGLTQMPRRALLFSLAFPEGKGVSSALNQGSCGAPSPACSTSLAVRVESPPCFAPAASNPHQSKPLSFSGTAGQPHTAAGDTKEAPSVSRERNEPQDFTSRSV